MTLFIGKLVIKMESLLNKFLSTDDYRKAVRSARIKGRRASAIILAEIIFARIFFKMGPLYYSLFSLDQKGVNDWGDYIVDKEANLIVRRLNGSAGQQLVTDKLSFYRRLIACGLPTIAVLAVLTKSTGSRFENDPRTILTLDEFMEFADDLPDELFFKTIDGSNGSDAFSAIRQGSHWEFDGKIGCASDLYAHCARVLGDRLGWLIQARVRTHKKLAASLSPGALGTVRIVTALNSGGVSVLAALLKIPVGQCATDNFSQGASGNIVAPIDIASGRLGVGQMSRSRNWPEMKAVDRHPDTGSRISGFQLPYWDEAVRLVIDAQREIKEAPTLGWDVALTDAGPLVVEANAGYGVEIHEVAEQRGLRSVLLDAWRSTSASS